MAQSSEIERLIEEIAELRRLVTMGQPRLARVKSYEKGKVRLWLDDKADQSGGQGGSSGSGPGSGGSGGSGGTGGAGGAGGTGSGSQGGSQDGSWESPWVWPGENHVGYVRQDTPYKEGQLVWAWSPNGDPSQAMILPGPPTKENKLPDHRDDKKVTRQIGNQKEERSTDGKSYKVWMTKDTQQSQGSQGGAQSSGGQSGAQQSQEDKPEDILHHFEMLADGGLRIKSQKQIEFVANADPTDESKQVRWTMKPDSVEQKVGDQTFKWEKGSDGKGILNVTGGKMKHDDLPFDKTHTHGKVQSGGAKTGEPEKE